jgi:catechol O-methyltransferase
MSLKTQFPFLRWSVIRLMLGTKHLEKEWQVGDGREEACAQYVLANARAGDIDDAIRTIDEFAYRKQILINVGDEKGQILDAALTKAKARRALELGAYVGYSALRTARKLQAGGRLFTIEYSADNANITGRILSHAGALDRVTVVRGFLGDGGATIARLTQELNAGELDFVFIDHAKDAYVPDLERILQAGWLHPGSIVVADNVRFPGAPEYQAYMTAQEGKRWRTVTHETHAEYQTLIKDIVLESTFLG